LSLRLRRDSIRARTTTPRLRRFSTFLRGSLICAVANIPFAADQELAYLCLRAQRTHSETPDHHPAGCC
jgi:hypothetical protein